MGPQNNILVEYHGKKHDVTYQSERQKYSVVRYLKNVIQMERSVFVTNFIWLKNVSSKELSELKHQGEHNVLPKNFSLKWLLMLVLSQSKPYEKGMGKNPYWASSSWDSRVVPVEKLGAAFELFENIRKNVGNITRSHFERMSKKILKDQKFAEAILDSSDKGGKFVIIQGKAGTGKTVKLLNIACDLCLNYQKRCLILTYNFTLVADIRRTLTFAHIPDGVGRESVRIMTLFKFFIDLFEGFGIYTGKDVLDDREFFRNYETYCKELAEFIRTNKKSEIEIEEIMQQNHQLVNWDYIMIDEAQDWNPFEVEILYSIFGPDKIVISQAPDQKVRASNDPKWVKPKWRLDHDFVQTNERKSFRQKANLVSFVNQFADKHHLAWELEPNEEFVGGRVIITTNYDLNVHKNIYADCLKSGNKAYEMLFLVPPSKIVNDADKMVSFKRNPQDTEVVSKLVKQKHCSLVDEFEGQIKFWDGTNKELRRDYPVSVDQHRLIQYESCRGLEGWSVVCIEMDELVRSLMGKYREDPGKMELALESEEEKRDRFVFMWALIPLTRAIDTLVITIKDPKSALALKLREIYEENREFVEWRV
ncbi:AAA family ATPase [Pedobacter nyackensis]|uniref:AAA family ATPase n=1 Tax=Pedobacter nyackensis TaxID=475255 RepID=UPI00292E5A7B|nr:AAA family ATPase [Pedobacter nyackensis]